MTIPPSTLARFQGVTTICTCWKLTSRYGGRRIRATSHDLPVEWRDEVYLPGLSVTLSGLTYTLSFAPEPADISGALDTDALQTDDIRSGVWDGASLVMYQVDWQSPEHGVWLWSGYLTGIEDNGGSFSVRLASIKADLERTIGRVFSRRCDAEFGDARCGVSLSDAPQSNCDKRFATCRDVFANAVNFRGFPFMPGNDALISGPGDKRDGSSRGLPR